MIRWTFYFEEGNVKTAIIEEKEDERLERFVKKHGNNFWGTKKLLKLPAPLTDLYVNLDRVKCITRELNVETAMPKDEAKAEVVVPAEVVEVKEAASEVA